MTRKILNAVTATGAGAEFTPNRNLKEGFVQVQITGTSATILIEGRIDSTAPWATLATINANGITAVNLLPFMRANVSAINAATVNAWLSEQVSK